MGILETFLIVLVGSIAQALAGAAIVTYQHDIAAAKVAAIPITTPTAAPTTN
jgi:hypothetical protein